MFKKILTLLSITSLLLTLGIYSCTGAAPATGGDNTDIEGAGPGGTGGGGGGNGLDGATACNGSALPSFPDAEGFGACSTGARSSSAKVVYVTNTNASGPGSLQDAVDQNGSKYIVFSTSGVIPSTITIRHPNITIAGQTSPGGIIIQGGLICDNVYDPYNCQNIIVRHLRMRPGNSGEGDALRVGGSTHFMADHLSLENASDEATEISRSSNVTIQNSILAETLTDHNENGGLLINYSTLQHNLQSISIHHNAYIRLGGRTPAEISCENNSDGGLTSNCDGHYLNLEISHNLVWDAQNPLYYNRCTGNNQGNDCGLQESQYVNLNWIGNVAVFKLTSDPLMMIAELADNPLNLIYSSDNQMRIGTSSLSVYSPAFANSSASRLNFPGITNTPSANLLDYVRSNVGAYPLDNMDQRMMAYVSGNVQSTPTIPRGSSGTNPANDAYSNLSGNPVADSDQDGMPDAWESSHGLNPNVQDHNGTHLSSAGYSNLEVYLNELADRRVSTGQ